MTGSYQVIRSAEGTELSIGGKTLHSVTLYGRCIQDGVPTRENPVPIVPIDAPHWEQGAFKYWNSSAGTPYDDLKVSSTDSVRLDRVVPILPGKYKLNKGTSFAFEIYPFVGDGYVGNGIYKSYSHPYDEFTGTMPDSRCEDMDGGVFMGYVGYGQGLSIDVVEACNVRFAHRLSDSDPWLLCAGPHCVGFVADDRGFAANIRDNFIGGLPDGTRDELEIREGGTCVLRKRVARTSSAVSDGVVGVVGVDVMSSTGVIEDGADVYYKAEPYDVVIEQSSMPVSADEIRAQLEPSPMLKAEWWESIEGIISEQMVQLDISKEPTREVLYLSAATVNDSCVRVHVTNGGQDVDISGCATELNLLGQDPIPGVAEGSDARFVILGGTLKPTSTQGYVSLRGNGWKASTSRMRIVVTEAA